MKYFIIASAIIALTGCGVGRYNNQVSQMTWPTNTTTYYTVSDGGASAGVPIGYGNSYPVKR